MVFIVNFHSSPPFCSNRTLFFSIYLLIDLLSTDHGFIWYFRIFKGFSCCFLSTLANLWSFNSSFQTYRVMSFVFRGTRADLENGFPGFIPERRALVCTHYLHLYKFFDGANTCDALLFLCFLVLWIKHQLKV